MLGSTQRRILLAIAVIVVALALPATALAAAPTASTAPATNITSSSASLNGKLSPNLSTTTFHWDYATDAAYNSGGYDQATPDVVLAFQGIPFLVGDYTPGTTVTGLTSATTYHVRFVASNADGTATGSDVTFTTLP
jgi:hypothetical protein